MNDAMCISKPMKAAMLVASIGMTNAAMIRTQMTPETNGLIAMRFIETGDARPSKPFAGLPAGGASPTSRLRNQMPAARTTIANAA